ncbi:ribosome maturation factor RimM [Nocardioides sp. GY 10127]|nr:ribosome maturation factor RimM [Nocardioides sp. GY 10127]
MEVLVGRLGKPHGIRGEITVDVRTDSPELRFAPGAVLRAQAPRGSAWTGTSLTVRRARSHSGVLLVSFEEVADRSAAEAVRGVLLHATLPADERPEDPEEFYDHQLEGLTVLDTEGVEHGTVTRLVHGGAQDLLAVRTAHGERLVPFVTALVPEVDLDAGRVVVADRPGLLVPLPDED